MEWKRMPASMTSRSSLSFAKSWARDMRWGCFSSEVGESAPVCSTRVSPWDDRLKPIMRMPMYSMTKEVKTPAMGMAPVVASYLSSPRQSLANWRLACVKSCYTSSAIVAPVGSPSSW